jgi:hypothetical protein
MLLLLLACVLTDEDVRHAFDPDGDGVGAPDDCAPLDPTTYPGAPEIWYDGVDQGCDGGNDNDQDGDGYPIGIDCDDSDARVYPGAEELCGDGVVNDCALPEDEAEAEAEARAMCRLQGELSLADADLRFVGEHAGDSLGESVSSAGDVDGDGRADLLLGAHFNDEGGDAAGAAYVFLSTDELLATRSIIDLASADLKLIGEQADDQAGAAVHHARDVDGDGRADLVVGAFGEDDGGINSGAIYLLLSSGALATSGNSVDLANADLILEGEDAGDAAGRRLRIVDDVDRDGRSDLLISASKQSEGGTDAGAAYLLFGSGALASDGTLSLRDADLKLLGEAAYDRAGYSVASAGDVDGDGGADILIGATHNDEGGDDVGAVYLLYSPELSALGGATLSLAEADRKFIGEVANDIAGFAVDGAGDVDGDGYADLIVGAPYNDAGGGSAGAAYLLLSSEALNTDDKTIDLSAADVKFVGEEAGDSAGFAVAGAGDADGDGQSDLLVGAHGQDRGGADAGTVYLLLSSGALSSEAATLDLLDADLKLIGVGALDYTGTSVAGAGDINGDGLHDLLMGAFSHKVDPESDETEHGAAYVILGRSF